MITMLGDPLVYVHTYIVPFLTIDPGTVVGRGQSPVMAIAALSLLFRSPFNRFPCKAFLVGRLRKIPPLGCSF